MRLFKIIKQTLILFSVCFYFITIKAQNLVPNYSFEILDSCHFTTPNPALQASWASPWYALSSPDMYLGCNGTVPSNSLGYQHAQDGTNYSGFVCYIVGSPNGREYLCVKLTDTLKQSQAYEVGYYVSLSHYYNDFEVRNMGAYLADTIIPPSSPSTPLNVVPQIINQASNSLADTMNWVMVVDTFFASGTERYIAIGNMFDNANTNAIATNYADNNFNAVYYFIDNVFVYEIPGVVGIREDEAIKVSVYPVPNNGEFIVDLNTRVKKFQSPTITIFNLNNNLVQATSLKEGKTALNISGLSEGIYYYTITDGTKLLKRDKVIIIK
jgi:hypothetical protein